MAQALGNLPDGEASLIWQQLSESLDAFVAAWRQAASPPAVGDFLPAGPPMLRRLTLVEAIKVDLEYRWQARRWPKTIEEYLGEFPELAGDAVPCDVIYEEYHVRKQHGDSVTIDDYMARFPTRGTELRRLFELESPEQTAALVPVEPVPTFEAGQRVDDFDLLAPLGKGAFATVFLARQRSMQRQVALKISRDRGFEPQTLAQLDHPNIVRVYDQRQLAEHKMRLLYMQYVPGGTLQGIVTHLRQVPSKLRSGAAMIEAIDWARARRDEQPPSDSLTRYRLRKAGWPEVVCWLGARLANALAYAHQRGVLHRDVKPANVLVGADGNPKLADFNISFSKLDGATPAAYFGGSLAYMSPEQLEACDPAHPRQADELDGRCDVYSLGVVLWELLVLERPFEEATLPQAWSDALARMTALRRAGVGAEARAKVPPDCPASIVEVLLKCLEPNTDNRYATAGDLARALELCLQPRAHALLDARGKWRSAVKRHPVTSTILVGLTPNVVMCLLNIAYNWNEIVEHLGPDDRRVFNFQITIVNAVAYTLGLGYIFYSRGALFQTLSRLARGQKVELAPSDDMVHRLLTFGAVTAGITALLWTVSGFVFPAWIQYGAGPASRLTAEHYKQFIVSNLLCGMIAATQSYYVVTFFSVRYCYSWLLKARHAEAADINELADTARRGRIFLALTVSVPFLALWGVLLIGFNQFVIAALGGIGLAGCGLAYLLDLAIRADLSALAAVVNPTSDPLGGDTVESFLTGSRR